MKKYFPYLLGVSILVLLVVLVAISKPSLPGRYFDERITLKKEDKIPYGTAVARRLLRGLFPGADLPSDKRYPGRWDSVDAYKPGQAVIILVDYLNANEEELDRLSRFAAMGNSVFIIARSFSSDASRYYRFTVSGGGYYTDSNNDDSLRVRLERPPFGTDSFYTYPGRKYEGYFSNVDSLHTEVLGRNQSGYANFIAFKKGDGRIFIHSAPLAFSNYFILHKGNAAYYSAALSVIPPDVKVVLWNEYFFDKEDSPPSDDTKEKGWLDALFSHEAFKWGLLLGMATLVLYVLLGMRRRQRLIPVHETPKNDSLDFVQTLGRLYYDKADHKNLAVKMAAYFLEHVRTVYQMPTHTLNDAFTEKLSLKTGYPVAELQRIVSAVNSMQALPAVSESQLALFHQQLELFYQNTQNGRATV